MNIYQLVGRNIEITEALKNYLDRKLARLDRLAEGVGLMEARVVLSMAQSPRIGERAKAEIQVNLPKGLVRVEEADADMYAAIDRMVDRLELQLKRYKERHFQGHRSNVPVAAGVSALPEPEAEEGPQIVRTKRFAMKPMTPEDAAFEMEALGHDFFVFRNAETEEINVIYRRRDGNYGLIEPIS
ncbi:MULTISPECIES: ribosome hibernation-promoting factor, HPF/YfiA family [unclassified Meiothermus]|uniref:ribosome hibernation-promoting factor, HPF/YfiA family n=1 Tax=unclassified Meiothermus TaxID=370471 RepID=UPI000D7BBA51|nr:MULTISPECIES: ribosome-associated translation inhibitor RaiA [unclassified Meiothermus]PZA08774.1 ribosome-associated translation inhibitor RaiA [Meiothermus sp. Pnk-1]RYM40604.1 ribosome-associated translation inhibitor RaiA [Meiothermus sp. PNK-Is4]